MVPLATQTIDKKELTLNKKVQSDTPLREADVMWSRKIWREIDLKEKMNHMHLAIASTEDTNLKKRIASAVNIRENSIGNIESIRGKKQTLQYISKQLTRQTRYIDAYHDLFINSKNTEKYPQDFHKK